MFLTVLRKYTFIAYVTITYTIFASLLFLLPLMSFAIDCEINGRCTNGLILFMVFLMYHVPMGVVLLPILFPLSPMFRYIVEAFKYIADHFSEAYGQHNWDIWQAHIVLFIVMIATYFLFLLMLQNLFLYWRSQLEGV